MIWIWLLLALVPIAIVTSGLTLSLPYWRSPEKRWRDRVLCAYQTAQRQVHAGQAELQRLSKAYRDEKESLSQKAFERLLASISLNELEAFPGIGPATIGRLKNAGYNNLARLRNARIRIHGLGQRRLADVYGAMLQLIRQAESRFQAGAEPESQRLAAQLQKLESRYAESESRAKAASKAATEVVLQLELSVAIARQVTFWNYFWKDAHVVVPPELLHGAIPDVRAVLRSAEHRASKPSEAHETASKPRPKSNSSKVVSIASAAPAADTIPVARPAAGVKPPTSPTSVPEWAKVEGSAATVPADRRASFLRTGAAPTANESPQPPARSDPAGDLLEATLEFAFAIARTDGSISHKERTFIDEQLQRRYSHDAALYNRAKAWSAHYETGAIDIGRCLERVKECFEPAERARLLEFACQLAQASGPMNQREIRLLERVSREWGVPWKPPAIASVAASEPTESAPALTAAGSEIASDLEARALLEIEASARLSADLIRRQYNLLASRLAPEKVESLGLEFVAVAQSKRQAIRAAAESLMQPFGEPLDLPARSPELAELRHNPDLDAMFGV